MNEVPTVEFLKKVSEQGFENFKKEVLTGPTFKKILTNIEDSALKGYTEWRRKITDEDDIRELKIIREELQLKGFYCELVTEQQMGLLGSYNVGYFHVKWDK